MWKAPADRQPPGDRLVADGDPSEQRSVGDARRTVAGDRTTAPSSSSAAGIPPGSRLLADRRNLGDRPPAWSTTMRRPALTFRMTSLNRALAS